MPVGPWLIPAALGVADLLGGIFGAKKQASSNMAIARYQAEANQRLLQQQLDYDRPVNQMARFAEAGLNPHLIYGQGTPGNQGQPLRSPDIAPTNWQDVFRVSPVASQYSLARAQTQAIDANTRQTTVVTELRKLESQVVARNPLLHDGAFKATIDSMISSAAIKGSEVRTAAVGAETAEASKGWTVSKLMNEVQLLEQQFKLGELDQKIKAEVLNSKQFQNAILEVQKKFLADGNIGPAQIYQFIQLLLMKAL